MKLLILVLALTIAPLYAEDWTVNGKDYHDVTVGQVEADRVHITYDSGVGTILLADLPPELQKKFSYDPVVAKVATDAEAQREARSDAICQSITAQQQAAQTQEEKVQDRLKNAVTVCGTVFEKVRDGLLIQCPAKPMANAPGGIPRVIDLSEPGQPKRVYGLCLLKNYPGQNQIIDRAPVKIVAYSDGPYSYQATDGSTATISSYAVQPAN